MKGGAYPSFNPGGDRLVLSGGQDIYLINIDGQPAWSPNGQRLAHISQEDGNFEIYVTNADVSSKQRLTSEPASDGLPVWSPDGAWLAFRSDRSGSWAIYIMRPDGSDLRKVVDADVLPLWFFKKMIWQS